MKIFNFIKNNINLIKNVFLIIIILILFLISLQACSTKTTECEPKIVIQKEYVPVAPKLDFDVTCKFNKSNPNEYLKSLLDCIGLQKKAINVLQDTNKTRMPINIE